MNYTDEQGRMLLDILKEAISIEVFGIEYYSKLSEMVSDEAAKAVFRGLLLDEKGHKAKLEGILYFIDQEGSWYGYSFYTRWFRSGLTVM